MLANDFGLSPSAAADDLMRAALGSDDAVAAAMPSLPLPGHDSTTRERTRIFGRDAELCRLDALLTDDAGPRLALVVGPAGIGKSRLACEAADARVERDCIVLYGACHEGPATPYAVIIDAFTAVRLTPGVDDRFAAVADARRRSPRGARRTHGFDRAATERSVRGHRGRGRRVLGESRTLMLVVDDLQWADTASVRLLEQLLDVVPCLRADRDDSDGSRASAGSWGGAHALAHSGSRALPLVDGPGRSDVAAALGEQGLLAPDSRLVQAVYGVAPASGRWRASVIVPAIVASPLVTCGAFAAASAATLPGVATSSAETVRPSSFGAPSAIQSAQRHEVARGERAAGRTASARRRSGCGRSPASRRP